VVVRVRSSANPHLRRHITSDTTEELKLDGYRALAIRTGRHVQLRSRNNKDLGGRFPGVVAGLVRLPDETVIDGEVVALDDSGRPSFNALQNYAAGHPIFYYTFDLLILEGRDLRPEPLVTRRELLRSKVLPSWLNQSGTRPH
jgi:bifunctional non-homologous end joining protein LigD